MRRFVKWLKGDSNSRRWVRRKAVAGWMNVLIAIAAAVAVVTAGLITCPATALLGCWAKATCRRCRKLPGCWAGRRWRIALARR